MRVSVLDENGVFRPSGVGKAGCQKIRGNVPAVADRKADLEGFKTQKARRVRMRGVFERASVACEIVAA